MPDQYIDVHEDKNVFFITASLKAIIDRKEPKVYISYCPVLDLYSQGESHAEAKKNIIEATELFIESCLERNTLRQVLEECGFHSPHQTSKKKKSKTPTPPLNANHQKVIRFPAQLPVMVA